MESVLRQAAELVAVIRERQYRALELSHEREPWDFAANEALVILQELLELAHREPGTAEALLRLATDALLETPQDAERMWFQQRFREAARLLKRALRERQNAR